MHSFGFGGVIDDAFTDRLVDDIILPLLKR
jgi:hypothetical protein